MTLGGWDVASLASATVQGVVCATGVVSKMYGDQTACEKSKIDSEIEKLLKRVEPIVGTIFLTMLAVLPIGTKVHAKKNSVNFDPPVPLQGWNRRGVGCRNDFVKIMKRCIIPYRYYEVGSAEAKILARIHKIAIIALKTSQETYKEDDSLIALVQTHINVMNQFIQMNESPCSAEIIATFSEDVKKMLSDKDSSGGCYIMEGWTLLDHSYFAERLETIWKHYTSDNESDKSLVPSELQGLAAALQPRIKDYQNSIAEQIRTIG